MNQYDRENAVNWIEGYYMPRPEEKDVDAFHRAKQETIANFKIYLQNIEDVTYEMFDYD